MEKEVTPETCAAIRSEFSYTEGFEPLREQFDLGPKELRAHLYGDCSHDINEGAATPPVEKQVSPEVCATYRQQAVDNPIVEIAEAADQSRKAVARHAFGRCAHEIDTPPADPLEGGPKEQFTAEDCTNLRREYKASDYESVLDFSTQYEARYETVLSHIRGKCGHDITEPPVEGKNRVAAEISQSTCQEMREAWRSDPRIEFADIVDQSSVSIATAERHIKFRCNHDYETVPVEKMDLFAEYFEDNA